MNELILTDTNRYEFSKLASRTPCERNPGDLTPPELEFLILSMIEFENECEDPEVNIYHWLCSKSNDITARFDEVAKAVLIRAWKSKRNLPGAISGYHMYQEHLAIAMYLAHCNCIDMDKPFEISAEGEIRAWELEQHLLKENATSPEPKVDLFATKTASDSNPV